MKFNAVNPQLHAVTRLEVCVLIAIVSMASFLVYRGLVTDWRRMVQIDCVSNLRYIGLANRVWAEDHNGQFPMSILATNGTGTSEYGDIWKVYLMMSNEFGTPKILHCPEDKPDTMATDFVHPFGNSNISYFTGLDGNTNFPRALLSGDDNLQLGGAQLSSGLVRITSNSSLAWTGTRHRHSGNIGWADGSVEQLTDQGLVMELANPLPPTNHIVIP